MYVLEDLLNVIGFKYVRSNMQRIVWVPESIQNAISGTSHLVALGSDCVP